MLIQHAKDSLTHNNTPSCNCAVCLTGFQDDDAFTKTECYHYFHISCLERYIDVCTKDHEKEAAEIEENRIPQEKKELKIVCPVCREPISYVSDLETKGLEVVKSVEDDSFEPDESMRRWQEEMKKLFNKQKEKGGIIDLEAESNRFLLDISTTVSTPSLSTIPPGDNINCSAPKSEYCDKRNTVHSRSRRENYHKYGNRSYRDAERQRQQPGKELGCNGNGGNDNASMDKSCEEVSSFATKSVAEDSTEPNNIQDVSQDGISRNQAPEETPDLKECEEELKEGTDYQLNCSVSEKSESSEHVSDTDSTKQKKLIDTEQDKGAELDGIKSGQIDEKEMIQTDRTQNEKRNVQDNRRSKSGYNHGQNRGRNNHYFRTGERKFGNWRKRDVNNCTKDESHRSEESMAKSQHYHRSSGTTAGSQNQRRSGGASHHQRRSDDATGGNQHQRRNGDFTAGSQYQRRSGSGSQYQRRSSGGSTAGSQQQYRSGGGTARRNISESSEIKGSEKKQDVSDGLLKEILHGSNDNNEKGIRHKTTHSARNPSSRKDDDNRYLRENKPIKKDGQSNTGHQRYRHQRYQRNPKKFSVEAGKKTNIEDHLQQSAVTKQHNTNDNFQKDCSKLSTRSDVSKEAAVCTDDSKLKSITQKASLEGPVSHPPGFKSKTPILPPPGFD
ncbi:uncharacterized protein DDB_G0290685-like isoform X2 [Anneissia japonica]|nr:uncharacterized protein DDB_G0290685-like isoform X2 [Anneissia japonica]